MTCTANLWYCHATNIYFDLKNFNPDATNDRFVTAYHWGSIHAFIIIERSNNDLYIFSILAPLDEDNLEFFVWTTKDWVMTNQVFIIVLYDDSGFAKMCWKRGRLEVTVILRKTYTRIRIKTKVLCSHGE